MKMSQGMAGSIHQPNAMPSTDPEISGLFEEWLKSVEDEILEILKKEGSLGPSEIAAKLKISEKSARFFMDKMKKVGLW
jgi:predicted transcriptional regulator